MKFLKESVDEVLDQFSIFGRYHLQFMFLAMLKFSYTTMFSHNYIFATKEVEYRCIDDVFGNDTCGSINGTQCSEWIYDNPHSFVAEFQLACQDWKRTLVGTAHIFGYMLGLLIIGPLTDRLGRKTTFIWTGVTGAACGMAKSFSHSYWFYVSLEFLGPLIGDSYLSLYVLNMEIVSAKKRVIYHFLCKIGAFVGGFLLPLTAWGVPYWRNLLRVVYSPAFLFSTYYFLIDESPRWLLTKGKKDKAIAILEKICHKNKVKLEENALDKLLAEDKDNNIGFVSLLKMTFQSSILLKRCIVCVIWWTSSTFVYHGMMINSVSLQGNKYINFGLTQLVLLAGSFMIMFVLHNYKRRNPLICSFFAGALLCFVQPFLPTDLPWLSVMVYMASMLMSGFFFMITYIYTTELFPTYTRNTMHGLCSSLGRFGGILAPQTPLLMAYWSCLPMLVFGGACLVAGLATFLVPDTADDSLPDTVREAETIGKKKSSSFNFTSFNCFSCNK